MESHNYYKNVMKFLYDDDLRLFTGTKSMHRKNIFHTINFHSFFFIIFFIHSQCIICVWWTWLWNIEPLVFLPRQDCRARNATTTTTTKISFFFYLQWKLFLISNIFKVYGDWVCQFALLVLSRMNFVRILWKYYEDDIWEQCWCVATH